MDEHVLENINKAAVKFLTPLTEEEMYQTIVNEAQKLIGADYGSILLEQEGKLVRVYANAPFFNKVKIRNKGFTYTTFKSQNPFIIDVEKEKNFHPPIKKQGIKSIVHIPLSYKDKSIGVLTVHAMTKKDFSNREMEFFKLFGSLASLAIRKLQLYDETKSALEIRDMFISLVSHELRTPLTSINGYIQLLHGKMAKQDTIEAKWMKELYLESKRLTDLVMELLEINRIKQGQLQFNLMECYFSDIVKRAIKKMAISFPDRKVELINKTKTGKDMIIGDGNKLLQVILSLLANAAKFSPADSTIIVTLNSKKKLVTLQVTDKGVGIARKDIKRIFDGFYKGIHEHKEGMGVGLLLAKQIINYHRGEIALQTKEKKGTTVEIILPVASLW